MPIINTPRQYRAIEALVKHGQMSARELSVAVGCNNVPEMMRQLSKNGWCWTCERVSAVDRDGNVVRPGIYRLTEDSASKAADMLGIKAAVNEKPA